MLGSSKDMPWLVKITGLKETRRTVQVRMSSSSTQPSRLRRLGLSGGNLVGLRLSRILSETNDKVEFCLVV